jgi:magnesium transporter
MIRIQYRAQAGSFRADLATEELASRLKDTRGLLLIDFAGEPPEVCEGILRDTSGFHPLAIDDALRQAHVPKLDDRHEYLYLVLHALFFDKHNARIDMLELDVFLGRNYLVTLHDQPINAIEPSYRKLDGWSSQKPPL